MNDSKTIIFDFDGTIAKTLDMTVKIYNEIAHEYGCKQIREEDKEMLRSKNPQKYIRSYGVTLLKFPLMLLRIQKEMSKHIAEIEIANGMKESLEHLNAIGFNLGILTSNSRDNVKSFLSKNGLEENFDFIYTGRNIFGKDKVISRLIATRNLLKKNLVYIGDEIRDIEAAKKAGIPILSVSWGFNSKEILMASKPDQIADNPGELISCLKKILNAQ